MVVSVAQNNVLSCNKDDGGLGGVVHVRRRQYQLPTGRRDLFRSLGDYKERLQMCGLRRHSESTA